MHKTFSLIITVGLTFLFAKADIDSDFYTQQGYNVIEDSLPAVLKQGFHLITTDMEIPEGTQVEVEPGALVLFMKGTGLTVKGTFICRGTARSTLTLSSLAPDKYHTPLPSEENSSWEGITALDNGVIDIRYTNINNALKAVDLQSHASHLNCEMVNFRHNEMDLVIGGKNVTIDNGSFFSLSLKPEDKEPYIASLDSQKQKTGRDALTSGKPRKNSSKLVLPSCIVGGTGALAAVVGFSAYAYYNDKYDSATDWNKYSTDQVDKWEERRNAGYFAGVTGLVLTGISAGVLAYTWKF